MNKESMNIDAIILDLIMDHYNIQSVEGRRENLSSKDFDAIA